MIRTLVILLSLLLWSSVASAQSAGDCNSALQVCSTSVLQSQVNPGYGLYQELSYPFTTSCLAAGEQNSTWYVFTVYASGSLEFDIIPLTYTDDFDWSVYDITQNGCAGISNGTSPEIVCNYSVFPGNTGINNTGTGTSSGPLDPNYSAPANVNTGRTYALLINNSTLNTSGFNLNFTGSAVVVDNNTPVISEIAHLECDQVDSLVLTFSEPIQCASIAPDGSDFLFTAVNVLSAYGVNCNTSGLTHTVVLKLGGVIYENGNYLVTIVNGSDGNTILDLCNNATPINTDLGYVVSNIPIVSLGPDTAICDGEALTLNAYNPGLQYAWSTGENTQTIVVQKVPATIKVIVDRNGCMATDQINIGSACSIFVPNAFSPNGDGRNDVFSFISAHVTEVEIYVFNRWGVRVFYTADPEEKWDGSDGWGDEYPAGAYTYVVKGTFRSGKPFMKTGNVLLLR